MKRLRLDDAAKAELREAALFYSGLRPGLGEDCLAEAEAVFRLIRARPTAGRVIRGKIRQYRLRRFPYYIIFADHTDHILVVAFMHQSRLPGYWEDRI